MLKVNAEAISFEHANARHEHEWRLWEDIKLPAGKILIPGVITHCSNIVEHPELVAERIIRYVKLVGRENVVGGSDCGFSSQATFEPEIHPSIVWAKFQAMAEGARLATRSNFGDGLRFRVNEPHSLKYPLTRSSRNVRRLPNCIRSLSTGTSALPALTGS